MEDRLLTEKEACDFLCISRAFLAKRRMEGRDPIFVRLGASIRYRVSDLMRYVDERSSRRFGARADV